MNAEYVQVVGHGLMQTSIRRFRHPDTGRHVTVIGTFHAGTPDYFEQLREEILKLQAARVAVQCEGSGLLSCDETGATVDERVLLAKLRMADALRDQLVAQLGWTGQIGGLKYPSSWDRIDLNYLQIIRHLGPALARTVAEHNLHLVGWPDERNGLDRVRLSIAQLMEMISQDEHLVQVAALRDPVTAVLVTARTALALTGLSHTERDVALVWGLAHLPGLDAGLTAQGFVRTGDPRWFTVGSPPTMPSTADTTTADTVSAHANGGAGTPPS
jgi:hypothetical protein